MAANQLTTGERIWQAKRKTFPDPLYRRRGSCSVPNLNSVSDCVSPCRLGGVSTLSGAAVIQ